MPYDGDAVRAPEGAGDAGGAGDARERARAAAGARHADREVQPPPGAGRTRLLHEPLWTAYVNGRKIGYAVRREPTEDDLTVLQLLRTVSAGAGVLPADAVGAPEGQDAGDLAYMRAHFDRVVGSRDSESFYMLNPDGNHGPELSIFFIRI